MTVRDEGTGDHAPHSAQFLTDVRDLWWTTEQLQRAADVLGLSEVRDVVDVGCGLGHWGRSLARVLPAGAHVTGIDREPQWVRDAPRGATASGVTFSFAQGDALALPLPDACADLVTCQTLLIHVADPRAVLKEMHRVLRPGGRVLLAEPNNLGGVAPAHAGPDTDVELLCAAFRLEVTCERGKAALGLGYNSIGERVPGLLDPALWRDLHGWLCERAWMARPPYSADVRTMFADEERQLDAGNVLWGRNETLRYFLAGGGDPAAFDALWQATRALAEQRLNSFHAGTYAGAEGSLFYLFAARRA